jgi:hypothetical protein
MPDAAGLSRAILGSLVALRITPHFIRSEYAFFVPEFEELQAMFERAIFGA